MTTIKIKEIFDMGACQKRCVVVINDFSWTAFRPSRYIYNSNGKVIGAEDYYGHLYIL